MNQDHIAASKQAILLPSSGTRGYATRSRGSYEELDVKHVGFLRLPKALALESARPSRKDILLFTQQLGTLIGAGMPLLSAVQLLRDQARNKRFRTELDTVMADLKGGATLHKALARSGSFPPVYVRMVEAGERAGTLESVLKHLVTYLQREIAAAAQIKKALTYPAIVVVVAIVVVTILVTTVLPTLSGLLGSFNTDTPLLTRSLLGLSHFIERWKLAVLVVGAALGVGGAYYSRRPSGQLQIGRFLLFAPVLGRLVVARNLARFSRTMSILLEAGLPITECLEHSRASATNPLFRSGMDGVARAAADGRGIAAGLAEITYLPGLYVQMMKAGEESGSLERNLSSMADFYEKEAEEAISTLTSLIEPGITIVLGVVTALIALAVMLPMFQLMRSIPT